MTPLIAYGASMPDVVKLVAAINHVAPTWELSGFIDDTPEKQGGVFFGLPILGPRAYLRQLDLSVTRFYNNVASSTAARRAVTELMVAARCRFATLVHPSVDTTFTVIGEGTSLAAFVHLGAGVDLGEHCVLRHHVGVGHEAQVADHVFIGPSATVAGRVVIESGVYIGAGSVIREGLTIGRDSVVGAGAVVLEDVPPGMRVGGVPARELSASRSQ